MEQYSFHSGNTAFDFILHGRSWVEQICLLGPFPFVFLAQNSYIFIRLAESKWYNV
jgi:hypothetical protein